MKKSSTKKLHAIQKKQSTCSASQTMENTQLLLLLLSAEHRQIKGFRNLHRMVWLSLHDSPHSQPCPYYPRANKLLTLVAKHTSWRQGTSTWIWGSCLEEIKTEQNLNCFSANSKTDFLNYLSTCVPQGLCLTDFVENQGTKQRENIYSYSLPSLGSH